jgi:ribosomal protein L32
LESRTKKKSSFSRRRSRMALSVKAWKSPTAYICIVCLHTRRNSNQQKDCGLQTNEPIGNRCFKNLDELEAVLFERCRKLLNLKPLISGLTHFYWWPEAKD